MSKRLLKLISLSILFISCLTSSAQTLRNKLSKIPGITFEQKTNNNFQEYYELTITQPVDHTTSTFNKFPQRIYIGFKNFNAPVVMETDGYAIDYASKPEYTNELSKEFKANLIIVEHRFFGKSLPDKLNWNFLTAEQAAKDYHQIKKLLDTILTGKWISTGISKGGQAALAYKLHYPNDVSATVVYGAAVKNKQTVMTDSILKVLSKTNCGKRISELQLFAFKNKSKLLPIFNDYITLKKFDFAPLDYETVFDYLLLELPFSFWQNGTKCEKICDTSASSITMVDYIINIVLLRFYSAAMRKQLELSFYMFYHEFGYYEYNTAPFKQWLKQENYSNKFFAPSDIQIQFDNGYQKLLGDFMKSSAAKTVFFIYGEFDPWALQTVSSENKFIVSNGSHKSRITDLPNEQRTILYDKLNSILKK